MEEQRQRAKAAAVSIDLTLQDAIDQVAADQDATRFKGYDALEQASRVQALVVNGEPAQQATAGDAVQIVLDTTPFYGEGGGQVGDRGVLAGEDLIVAIESVSRTRDVFVHAGRVERGQLAVGDAVQARWTAAVAVRPKPITPRHLLQAALKRW